MPPSPPPQQLVSGWVPCGLAFHDTDRPCASTHSSFWGLPQASSSLALSLVSPAEPTGLFSKPLDRQSAAQGARPPAQPPSPSLPLTPTEYKASYARNRSVRSATIGVDGGVRRRGLDAAPQPRNLTKRHWPGAPQDLDKDAGDFSGTGGLPDYSAPNPIKVTHR